MTAANMPIATRYHGLDFMRAGMMLMGILLHAGVMYMPLPYGHDSAAIIADPLDPYRDISGYSGVVQRIVMTIHFFRMPAFMLLAGFFGALVFQKNLDNNLPHLAHLSQTVTLPAHHPDIFRPEGIENENTTHAWRTEEEPKGKREELSKRE